MISIKPKFITAHGVLYNADCMDVMRSLPSDLVDCVFADPPI